MGESSPIGSVLAALLWVCAFLFATTKAHPYSVDDLLKVEGFGQIVVAPGGRWLVFERHIALEDAFLFDQGAEDQVRNRLYRVDLAHLGPATPLLPLEAKAGLTLLGFSPSGRLAAVGRFDGANWTLGIVEIASGAVNWLDISPDYYPFRTTLAWVTDDRLVLIARAIGRLPWLLGAKRQEEADFTSAWKARTEGSRATVTAVGSGHFLDVTPKPMDAELISIDLPTGRQTLLARGNFQNLTLAPDGRSVAVTSDEEAIRVTDPAPITEGTELRRRRLQVVDLSSGQMWDPCPSCDVPYHPPLWSRSGRRLLFYSRDRATGWQGGRFLIADVRTRTATSLAADRLDPTVQERRGDYAAVGMGWLGERPIVFAHGPCGTPDRSDWYAVDRHGAACLTRAIAKPAMKLATMVSGETMVIADRPWLLDDHGAHPVGGSTVTILPAPSPSSGVTPASPNRLLMTTDGGRFGLLAHATGRASQPIVLASLPSQPVTASLEQQAVVTLDTDPHGAASLVVAGADGETVVARINTRLDQIDTIPPQQISYRSPTGEALTGWLYLPEPAVDGRKPPLLVLPYASAVYGSVPPRSGEPGQQDPTMNVSVLRGHGYAVLVPSLPVPAAADDHPFDFAGPILAAVDAVIAQGVVDPKRLAIWGHSFGGYTTAMIISETNRFRAAIVSSGPYDLTGLIGDFNARMRFDPSYQTILQWSGYAETGPPRLLATPWQKPARYVANSPLYRAGKIETPVMIIASDRDFVGLEQGEKLFSALYRQGKDAVLLSYWGEEHGVTSPANIRDVYRRAFAWIDGRLDAARPSGAPLIDRED